jgi:hypothetical protein
MSKKRLKVNKKKIKLLPTARNLTIPQQKNRILVLHKKNCKRRSSVKTYHVSSKKLVRFKII